MSEGILTELHYLPCVGYFKNLIGADKVLIDDTEKYQKQTFRNRCRLLTANKVADLSIPVHQNGWTSVKDVKIDYHQKWVNNHWRTIQSAYGKAPFFEYYAPLIKLVYDQKYDNLYQLNFELLKVMLEILQLEVELLELSVEEHNKDKIVIKSYKDIFHPKKEKLDYDFKSYHQIFGESFKDNLSVLDLLFCEGSNSLEIIRATATR